MYRFQQLVFTGMDAGKRPSRELQKYSDDPVMRDPTFVFVGSINYDRTVATTILYLCARHSNCTPYEIYEHIAFCVARFNEHRAKWGGGFKEGKEVMSLNQVKRSVSSVVRRSKENASKYIPNNIRRVPHTEYLRCLSVLELQQERDDKIRLRKEMHTVKGAW